MHHVFVMPLIVTSCSVYLKYLLVAKLVLHQYLGPLEAVIIDVYNQIIHIDGVTVIPTGDTNNEYLKGSKEGPNGLMKNFQCFAQN